METNGIGYMDYLGYAGYLNVTCYIGYFGYQQSLNERTSYLNYSLSNILKLWWFPLWLIITGIALSNQSLSELISIPVNIQTNDKHLQ